MKSLKRDSRSIHKKSEGFTLVELICILTILAIMAAILVPALLGYIDRAKKAETLVTAKHLMTASQSVAVEFYNENNGSWETWNRGNTSYRGNSALNQGPKKLRNFISDCTRLCNIDGIGNYQGPGSDKFFCAMLNKTGVIEN